jgi:hypothetical protein
MRLRDENERGSPTQKVARNFRIDPELLEWLEEDARANGRSVAGSLRYHLQRSKECAA